MTWLFENKTIEELPEECIGFVYLITNNVSGRKYIGKKLAKFSKTITRVVKLKNGTKKKKKIRSKIDSDWQTYYGSNIELNKDVELLGSENFTREILYYCNSKAECSYSERTICSQSSGIKRILQRTYTGPCPWLPHYKQNLSQYKLA